MDDQLFDWDHANITHIAEHDVTPEEAEEVVLGNPLELGCDEEEEEPRWTYLGETLNLRILQIVVTTRGEKVRVVTAFEPIRRFKQIYLDSKVK